MAVQVCVCMCVRECAVQCAWCEYMWSCMRCLLHMCALRGVPVCLHTQVVPMCVCMCTCWHCVHVCSWGVGCAYV